MGDGSLIYGTGAGDLAFRVSVARAGRWLGWCSIGAVLLQLSVNDGSERGTLLVLTIVACGAHIAFARVPWERWLELSRGTFVLDLWSGGLLAFAAVLVSRTGATANFDLLFFLIVPFVATIQSGIKRTAWLAVSAAVFTVSVATTAHPYSTSEIVIRACLLSGAAVLALALARAVRAEATARADSAVRAELEHALLTEAHHRVKNSLQTVADLLFLARPPGPSGDQFDRMASRVRAIASVHERLAEAAGGNVRADKLINGVVSTTDPTAEVDADPVQLTGTAAQHLAIVTNELVTNAALHGHHPIRVELRHRGSTVLTVTDAGTTEPNEWSRGLGLCLVSEIVEHALHGRIDAFRQYDRTVVRVTVNPGTSGD